MPEKWKLQCERFLSGRTLERALVGELSCLQGTSHTDEGTQKVELAGVDVEV